MPRKKTEVRKTKIRYKFLRPMGLVLTHYGNRYPEKTIIYETFPDRVGRFPRDGYDFDKVFEEELLDEFPKPLPDIFDDYPVEVKTQYLVQQANLAAQNHAANNVTRSELDEYASKGYIEIIEDSFMDAPSMKKKEPDKVPVAKNPKVEKPLEKSE